MKRPWVGLVALVAMVVTTLVVGTGQPTLAQQQLDEYGNIESPGEPPSGGPAASLGQVLNSFPNPSALRGLTFRGGKLWGVTASGFGGTGSGVLYQMDADTGAVISTLAISPAPGGTFGLGHDTKRNLFVVTDALADEILTVEATSGAVVDSFPSPGGVPVGAAYDSLRDAYWIADGSSDTLDLVDPDTGAVITTLAVPAAASRIAGAGYCSVSDAILFNSRDDAKSYLVSASDGSLISVFATPPSAGTNNGQGAAIRPSDVTGYLSNFEAPTIFVVDLKLGAPPCSLRPKVGGLSVDLAGDETGLPLETAQSSGGNAGLLAAVTAVVTAAVVTLGGTAWYAKRRLMR